MTPEVSNQLQKLPSSPARLFSYDAAGNPLNDGLRNYTWRNSGQLARVAYRGVVTDYTYNGFNQRLRKTSAGVTTYYSYDEAGHLQGEYAADGSLLAEHLWLGDTPVATVQRQADGSLATCYVFADHIDTPRGLSDANGKILWRWDGEGFGRSPPDADADGDGVALTYNLRFPGQVFDKESNLHYNWNRYYDPVTGRYVSSDPIGLAGGSFTTYGYVGGNPVGDADPRGLMGNGSGGLSKTSENPGGPSAGQVIQNIWKLWKSQSCTAKCNQVVGLVCGPVAGAATASGPGAVVAWVTCRVQVWSACFAGCNGNQPGNQLCEVAK